MSRPLLAEYVAHGWQLVPIPLGEKRPLTEKWNEPGRGITDPEIAEYMDGNVGLLLAYSGVCVIDLDDLSGATEWFAERGVDIPALMTAPDAVMIDSGRENRAKLLYRTATVRPSFNLGIFELHSGTRTGKTVQDVLPPSIHPVTGKAYEWRYADEMIGHWSMAPELPAEVAAIWDAMITPEMKEPKKKGIVPANLVIARRILAQNDPDTDYDTWIAAGMALHHETQGSEAGLSLWDEWSARGAKYKGRQDLEAHWRSFRSDTANPRTLAGLRKDEPASAMEFEIVTTEEAEASEAKRIIAETAEKPVPATMKEALHTLERDKSGTALAVLPNVLTILALPTICGQQIAYDQFKDGLMVAPVGTEEWRPFRDTDYTAIRLWLEKIGNFYPTSKDMVRDAVHYLGEANKMDTAQTWLGALVWDGVPRVERFMPDYMGTIDASYERSVGRYLWTALAGRIMEPGCQVDMVPILVGTQGLGKSQGVKALVPNPDFYVEIRLDEQDDAIARKMRGTLVGELAELRGLRNADLERIKAFVTRTHEKWTPKYVEFATTFARRLVMIGTTNDDEFLVDDENRRWLPVRTTGVNVPAIVRDRDQLWAEAMELWMEHGVQWQDAEKLAKTNQDEYKAEDNWGPIVYEWLRENRLPIVRSHDILTQAVGLDVRRITRTDELRVGKMLRSHGYNRTTAMLEGKKTKVWSKPGLLPAEAM